MKEPNAVRRTVPPSAEIEEQIERLLAVGVSEDPRESLSELARLGARLIIQRAVEDEFDAWLGRARYERRSGFAHGADKPSGLHNGFRPRRVHTLEGELEVDIPQVRSAAEPFVSKLFPYSTKVLRTEPLRAMVIGAFVRGLSMRDIEALCAEAGLGSLSKATASRICQELRERYEHFTRRDLYDVSVVALFLDALLLPVRPDGPGSRRLLQLYLRTLPDRDCGPSERAYGEERVSCGSVLETTRGVEARPPTGLRRLGPRARANEKQGVPVDRDDDVRPGGVARPAGGRTAGCAAMRGL